MTQIIRKQIYIEKRQQALLKRLAKLRGVSEAEVVRQAIDQQARLDQLPHSRDPKALQALVRFARERRKPGVAGEPYRFNRAELYEERENRWLKDR